MKTRTCRRHQTIWIAGLSVAALALCVSASEARHPDGTIHLLRSPISNQPVILRPGDTFEADLRSVLDVNGVRAFLTRGDERLPIWESDRHTVYRGEPRHVFDLPSWDCLVDGWKMSWMWRPRKEVQDRVRVAIHVPPGTPAGFYGLEIHSSAGRDHNPRSVCVIEAFPEDYTIVQITDTHIGRKNGNAEAHLAAIADAVNALRPAFVLHTGDITDDNFPEDHSEFIRLLDRMDVPTFVVGGNHDNGGMVYEGHADQLLYYGEPYYAFDFGRHHYIGIDNASRLFDEHQVAWIKADLAAARHADARFLFGHALYLQSEEDKQWFHEDLWREYDVAMNLHGHWHRDEYRRVNEDRTAWICSAAAVDNARYTVIQIRNHRVESVDFRSALDGS